MDKTVIFHIPHDGNQLEESLMSSVIVDHEQFLRYHDKMRDTDATLFVPASVDAKILKFEVSRLLCDVERFIGDNEIMEKYGMGFCYERVYDGTVIKKINSQLKDRTYVLYAEHHRKLDELVKEATENIVLIDLHSFSKELIVHQTIEKNLPDICIGFDDLSLSVKDTVLSAFLKNGFSVDVNYPYQGSMIPNCILSKEVNKNLISFMIEVNKDCYIIDGKTDTLCIEKIRNAIQTILQSI